MTREDLMGGAQLAAEHSAPAIEFRSQSSLGLRSELKVASPGREGCVFPAVLLQRAPSEENQDHSASKRGVDHEKWTMTYQIGQQREGLPPPTDS